MKRRTILPALSVLFAVLVAPLATAQVVMRHGGGDAENDVVFLRELGVIAGAAEGSDAVEVIMLMPDTKREVSLERGDLVLMINGQRIRDLATLREAYEGAAVGDVVKLGFRRGDERFLSSFEKTEAEAEGGQRIMMIAGGPGGEFDDLQPLQEFGVLLAEKDGKVTVSMELPMGEVALRKGDLVRSINGESIASLSGFREVYESVEVGQEVALSVERDGERIDVTRSRSSSDGIRVRKAH